MSVSRLRFHCLSQSGLNEANLANSEFPQFQLQLALHVNLVCPRKAIEGYYTLSAGDALHRLKGFSKVSSALSSSGDFSSLASRSSGKDA